MQHPTSAHRLFVNVSEENAHEIAALYSQLQQIDSRLPDVRSLARRIGDLKSLPSLSSLIFLGYFGVLESLLTHNPKPSDPYDSITRQVKSKIALLNNRWTAKIDYAPFGSAVPDKVWTKMYSYRSLLAHGGTADFSGELACLVSHAQALGLIKQTVKAVIRHALAEPQLLLDLREC